MLLAEMVAGAPFFFAAGGGDGVALGDARTSGVAAGLGDGDSAGVGDGDAFFFFLGEALGELSGVGLGEVFLFFFGETDALASDFADGVGLADAFCFLAGDGVGDFSGVALGFGEGDFSALSFLAVELLRCFRGVGVGVGAKIFLSLLPNDSSARARSTTPSIIAIRKRVPAILLACRMERESSTGPDDEEPAKMLVMPSRADGEGPRPCNLRYLKTEGVI
jgi:hypothetical protein